MRYKSLVNKLNQKAANKQLLAIRTREIILVNKYYNNVFGSFCLYENEPLVTSNIEL